MSKLNPDSWSVTNKTDFDIVLIDVTPNLKKPELSDFNVEKLNFFADGVIKPGDTSHISMRKFEKTFYREVIIARAVDAFPVKRVVPQFEIDSHNYIPCIVTKEDFDHSQSVLESIKDFYAGKISELTTDLNAVIKKTYDKNSFTQTRKDISAFLGVHYRNYDPGPIQYLDNLHMVESYLNTFPDHWILSNNENSQHKASKLFVYYAADLELTTGNKTIPPLSCTGTVSFVEPKKQLCDLQKGNNNGYQIHLDASGKGSTTLSFLNGAFIFTTDDNIKVTLKPVPMQRGVVYSGVKLKHVTEKISNDDLIIVFVGKILDEIVIAIPDEIDLEKQNTGNINNTPLAPGWKYKNIGLSILAALLFSMSVLSCYIARKKFLKNKIITNSLINSSDEKMIWTAREASNNLSAPDSGEKTLLDLVKTKPIEICAWFLELFGINNNTRKLVENPKLEQLFSLEEEDDITSVQIDEQADEIINGNIGSVGVTNELPTTIRAEIHESKVRANSLPRTGALNSAVTSTSVVAVSNIEVDNVIKTVKDIMDEAEYSKAFEDIEAKVKLEHGVYDSEFYNSTFRSYDADEFLKEVEVLLKETKEIVRDTTERVSSIMSDEANKRPDVNPALLTIEASLVNEGNNIQNETDRFAEASARIHDAFRAAND